MATRIVEGKKPYTGGKAISIDENKVISLNLRDENNLIIYDSGDDEIYVDLQLPDGITPTDAFPVGVTTGRAVVADGWDKAGTIISAKTTSGDEIKILYADDGTLWIDNGTGTFKQIYFKADVDAIAQAIWNYISANCNTKTFYDGTYGASLAQAVYDWISQGNYGIIYFNPVSGIKRDVIFPPTTTTTGTISSWSYTDVRQATGGMFYEEDLTGTFTVSDGVATSGISFNGTVINNEGRIILSQSTAPSDAIEGTTWYDTTTHTMKVWDGTAWQSVGGGSDIVYTTQAEYNALLPGALTDNKHYFIYTSSTPSGRPLGANTVAYYPLNGDILDHKGDYGITGTMYDLSVDTGTLGYTDSFETGKQAFYSQATSSTTGGCVIKNNNSVWDFTGDFTVSFCVRPDQVYSGDMAFVINRNDNAGGYRRMVDMNSSRYLWFHGYTQYLSTYQLTLGTWYNITCTVVSGTYTIYVNGTSVKSGSYSYSSSTPGYLSIGGMIAYGGNLSEMLNGCICEVIIDGEGWDATKVLERARYLGFA